MGRMARLRQALTDRILVLDGAMGTMLQAANLSASDFGGSALEGCNEHLNLTRPDVVRHIHAAYFDAGADIVLLVEIADSDVRRDRAKLLVYARAGVRELWLVDLTTDTIEVHREPAPDGYRLVRRVQRGETLTVEAFPDVRIPAAEILR